MTDDAEQTQQINAVLPAALAGDQTACSDLLARVRQLLRPEVDQKLGPKLRVRVDGSDLLQKVLMQVATDLPQFQGKSAGEFLNWVRRILMHDIQEILRREKYTAKRSIDREEPASQEIREAHGKQTSPSQRVIRKEQVDILREALAELLPEWQQVMRMKHLELMSLAEISRQLGQSEGVTTRQLHNGMKELKTILRERGISDLGQE